MASTVLPNGIIIPEKYSRDWYNDLYHNWQELDNMLGGGTPKDGTLTIQKNGSTVGTFSANQATDETIDIAVPTKTSDLTNDSNFVESSDLATVATSGSYNDLSNKPTIPTVNNATLTIQKNGTDVKTFTANASSDVTCNITVPTKVSELTNDSGFITSDNTKIPLAGSNQISGSLIPATTNAYDLGSPSYQWNNAYIKSLTVSDGINNKNQQQFIFNKEYSDATDNWLGIHSYLDKNNTRLGFYAIGDFGGNRGFRWFVRGQLTNSVEADIFSFGRKRNETSYMYINATLESDLIPTYNNSKSLGTSTNKWKSLNGLNPGALSLPSNSYVNVDTTNWDLTCQNELLGSFTPTADGWLMLHIANSGPSEANFWIIGEVVRINSKSTLNTSDNNNFNMITIPVEKDKTYNIYGNASEYVAGRSIAYCRFMPCRGNV